MYPPFLLLSISIVLLVFFAYDCKCLEFGSKPIAHHGAEMSPVSTSDTPETSVYDEEDRPEKVTVHDYFVTYLPRCPTSFTLFIETPSKVPAHKKPTGTLKTGQYSLCRQRGRARLRECTFKSKTGQCIPKAEYLVTVVKKSGPTPDSVLTNNSVEMGDDLADVEGCQLGKCPSNQLMAINMKNPTDCSSFFICIMGQHLLLTCPPGHQFSEEYGVCIERKYSNCSVNPLC